MPDITGRAQLRAMLISILKTIPGVTVYSPGDWNVPAPKLPAVKLRQGRDLKQSGGRIGQTAFTTVSDFEIRFEVQANSGPEALALLETFAAWFEEVVFKSIPLRSLAQDFPRCETQTDVVADGASHVGVMSIVLGVEYPEAFAPDIDTKLLDVNLVADLTDVADRTGTYPNPPFPNAVTPAPRTRGPDGRAEGTVNVQFP